jgi:hypothetical protein
VVREVAAEHGYADQRLDVDDTGERLDVVNQSAESDARFLKRLATKEQFEFRVDEEGLHWRERRQDAPPVRVLTWYADPGRGDVMAIHVESDLMRRAGRVTVRGRDPMTRTTIESSATNETTARATLGDVVEVVDPETGATAIELRNATASIHPTPASTERGARRESEARFRRAERATVEITMQVVGDPTLKAGTVVELRGVSPLLSGKYYVTEVRHSISASGYTCDLKLTRDGVGRVARRPARPQQGERNTHEPRRDGALTQVEVVDRETGATHIEYRR